MRLIFISREQYPHGGAASNRHMAFAKGLLELGHQVVFVLLERQSSYGDDFVYQDIHFKSACTQIKNSQRTLPSGKVFSYFRLIQNARQIIFSSSEKEKFDATIILSRWNKDIIPFLLISRSLKMKAVHERTEYPFIHCKKTIIGKLSLAINLNLLIPRFDGLVVINHVLEKYFRKYVDASKPIKIINMIVDPSRFKRSDHKRIFNYLYIAYCGTLNDKKDGVDILIKAYLQALSKRKIPTSIKLVLIGEYEENNFRDTLVHLIENSGYSDNIVFTGKISRDDMPGYLCHAEALLLARPSSKQAEGGFPTKLGEYLATGKPVILTNTGEVGYFLKDGINAFIAEPGSIESFASRIELVFSDYEMALEVGKNGELLVQKEFNYFQEALKLEKFIEEL